MLFVLYETIYPENSELCNSRTIEILIFGLFIGYYNFMELFAL